MNSGSSGSIGSSSGGDQEEYDSRGEGMCGFLNNNPAPPGDVGPMGNPVESPATHHPHHNSSSSSLFDPFSNLFDPLPTTTTTTTTATATTTGTHQNENSLLNLDNPWPRNPRSDRHPIQLPGSIPPSSSQTQSFFMTMTSQLQAAESNAYAPPRPRGLSLTTDPISDVVHTHNNAPTPSGSSIRNPRKRTRASRRAPTTVLTTDTSNFRAMVQEFTGIPPPPFTPASSFPRARLDVFGGTSTSSPPYPLRPFPQKLSPFANSNSPTTTSLLSPSSHFLLPKQNHHISTMTSIFNLNPPPPLQQQQQQQPTHNSNINLLGSELQVSVDSAQTTTENRNPHHHLHQTPLPPEFLTGNVSVRARDTTTTWGSAGGGGGGGGGPSDQPLFRSFNAKYCTPTKLNNNFSPSSSSSDFHGDKGSDNVITRSEGMIESWICSSD